MYHALDLGISARDFWDMSPRAVLLIQAEMMQAREEGNSGNTRKSSEPPRLRLSDVPRP